MPPDNDARRAQLSRIAVPVTRFATVLGGTAAVLFFSGLFVLRTYGWCMRAHFDRHPPLQYYPVQSFRTSMVVAGGEVYLAPSGDPGDLTPEPVIPDEHRAGAHVVEARVVVERPIPLTKVRTGRSAHYKGYDRLHPAPASAIERAGPEFGVTVELWAYGVPIPKPDRERVMHRLADDISRQSGDPSLVQWVVEGGKPAPALRVVEPAAWIAPLWYAGWAALSTSGVCVLGLYVRGRSIRRRILESASASLPRTNATEVQQ